MKNVGKENTVKRAVGKGKRRAVEDLDWDVGMLPGKHVDSSNLQIWAPGLKSACQQPIAASHIQHTTSPRRKLIEPRGENLHTPSRQLKTPPRFTYLLMSKIVKN